MSLMQSPDAIVLLRRAMSDEEQARNRHPRGAGLPTPPMAIRIMIGRTLIAAGTRLATAAPRDHHDPAMGTLSIAS